MLDKERRTVFLVSMSGGIASAFLLAAGMKVVEIMWYSTSCLS